jgi:signal transduction histidine kinase
MTDDQLINITHLIIEHAMALLNSDIAEKQRSAIKVIIANVEKFYMTYTEFSAVPLAEVTANMRHELGNPLTPIYGYSELLGMDVLGSMNDDQMKHVRGIYELTQQLRSMVDDLVTRAREQAASHH